MTKNPFFPHTPENRAALRTAIATISAILVGYGLHLNDPYWSGMTVLFLANIYSGSVIDKALMRLSGTFIGVTLGYFLAGFVVNSFFLYFLANFFYIAIACYFSYSSKYPYAYFVGAVGGFLILSKLATVPNDILYVAIWRFIEISVGVVVSGLAAFSLFPNSIQDNVVKEVNEIFADLDVILVELNQLLTEKEVNAFAEIVKKNMQLKRRIHKSSDMLGFMRREAGLQRHKIDKFRLLFDSFNNLSHTINYFTSSNLTGTLEILSHENVIAINNLFKIIRENLATLKDACNNDTSKSISFNISNFEANLEVLTTSSTQYNNSLTITHLLRQLNTILSNLRNVLITGKGQVKNVISNERQLSSDPDVIINSIKVGLTAVLALAFWLMANWPGGVSGIISSIVISINRNLFDMKYISIYRILGCFLGCIVVYISLCVLTMNLYLCIVTIFLSVWAFCLLSYKHVSFEYVGLQANIVLVMSLATAGGPPTNVAAALERLAGIFIGIAASFLVANLLWRTNLLTMLMRQLRKLKKNLLHNCNELLTRDKDKRIYYDLTNSFWLCLGLLENIGKERLNPTKILQLATEKKMYENLAFFQVIVDNIHENIDQESARQLAAQFSIDLKTLELDMAALYQQNSTINREEVIQKLEAASSIIPTMHSAGVPLADVENCAAYFHSLHQMALLDLARS